MIEIEKIIEQIYNGECSFADKPMPQTTRYQRAFHNEQKYKTIIKNRLPKNNHNVVDKLHDCYMTMAFEECEVAFKAGFSLFANLMLEAIRNE